MDWLSPISKLFDFALPFLERVPVIRAILGFILVFFLPGFTWTLVFFKQLNFIERVTISLALSIAVITLSLLLTSRLLGIRIAGPSSALVIVLVTILPLPAYYLNKLIRRKGGNAT